MLPRLLWNRLRQGRALDVLVTHAPPRDINDRPDQAHRGFRAIRRFLGWFHPRYMLHGHVHLYDRTEPHIAHFGETEIINVYPYQQLDLEFPGLEPAHAAAPAPAPAAGMATKPTPAKAAPPSADPAIH
jgi:hypothetical protein